MYVFAPDTYMYVSSVISVSLGGLLSESLLPLLNWSFIRRSTLLLLTK